MSVSDDRQHDGVVFNIQKYSVHDGPGIRTIVFLKGCPLSCHWCSNPESQQPHPELAYNAGRCLGLSKCVRCLEVCVRGALTRSATAGDSNDMPCIDRKHCAGCHMPCANACPAQGIIVYGQKRTATDVLDVVEQDSAFYTRSSGGLTLSGGEPLHQGAFALALLREAKKRRIKTAVETCGAASEDTLRQAAPLLNYALFDIKHMDGAVHKAQTGMDNSRILTNFKILAEEFPDLPILARTPVVPGFNDTEEAIADIATFLAPYAHVKYEMLAYHRLGTQKYVFLGRTSPMGEVALANGIMPRLQSTAQGILHDRVQTP